jgi:hypothetical protein
LLLFLICRLLSWLLSLPCRLLIWCNPVCFSFISCAFLLLVPLPRDCVSRGQVWLSAFKLQKGKTK